MAFLNEVLLAAADDAKARGDKNAARACYCDVLKTDPMNAAALAGLALLERGDRHHRETTIADERDLRETSVTGDHELPSPLLEGADLEELPPAPLLRGAALADARSGTPAPLLRGAALADARSGTPAAPGVILLPPDPVPLRVQRFVPPSPRAEKFSPTRAPKPLIHIAARNGAPEPLQHASERISIFAEPFQPPHPHFEAAGRAAPRRHRALLALLTGLALLLTTHAL